MVNRDGSSVQNETLQGWGREKEKEEKREEGGGEGKARKAIGGSLRPLEGCRGHSSSALLLLLGERGRGSEREGREAGGGCWRAVDG